MAQSTIKPQMPYRIEVGTGKVTAASSGKQAITFKTPFNTVPNIFFTIAQSSTDSVITVTTGSQEEERTTTEGFTAVGRKGAGTFSTGTISFGWVAIGT